MAIGAFLTAKYVDNAGETRGIRVKTATTTLVLGGETNDQGTGTTITPPRAKVSGGRRTYGVHARTVTVRLTAAGASGAIGSIIRVPWFKQTAFDGLANDTTGTYNGSACILVGKSPEKIK